MVSRWWVAVVCLLPALAGARLRVSEEIKAGYYAIRTEVPEFLPADAATKVFEAEANRWLEAEKKRFRRAAESLSEEFGKPAKPLEFRVTVESHYRSSNWISIAFRVFESAGGTPGNTTYRTINVGKVDGRVRILGLGDFFPKGYAYGKHVSQLVIGRLMANPKAIYVTNGQMKELDAAQRRQFTGDVDGLTFWIEPFAAGPAASGSFRVTLPWTELWKNWVGGPRPR